MRRVPPSTAGFLANFLLLAAAALLPVHAVASAALPGRLARADLVIEGSVVGVETAADGRLLTAQVRVTQVLRGIALTTNEIRVVEERPLPSLPAAFAVGDQVVLALRHKSRNSFLDKNLGGGPYLELLDGSEGILHAGDSGERATLATLAADWIAHANATDLDQAARLEAERALLLRSLAREDVGVAADAAQTLTQLAPIDAADGAHGRAAQTALAGHLAAAQGSDTELRALIGLAGVSQGPELLGPLETLTTRRPRLATEVWDTLAAYGAAPGDRALRRALRASEPELRQAAAGRLLASGTEAGRGAVARAARDDASPEVRSAIVALLARGDDPAGLEVVEDRFLKDSEPAVREAAGRALFERGDDFAAQAFERVAFTAEQAEQMRAVALLRALGRAKDAPRIDRIGRDHPDARVRNLAQHGLEVHDH